MDKKKRLIAYNIPLLTIAVFNSIVFLNLAPTYVGNPFAWIALLWSSILVSNCLLSANARNKLILFYCTIVILFFGLSEVYCRKRWNDKQAHQQGSFAEIYTASPEPPQVIKTEVGELVERHDILGYVLRKNRKLFCTVYNNGTLALTGVTHTIGTNGLRIPPPHDPNNCYGSLLFFGGSYTFGGYVNDEETLPYQVGRKLYGTYRIYNFGVNGYGTHQMLALVEQGIAFDIIDESPQYAVYYAIIDHVYRLSGLRTWDTRGPKYIFNKAGQVEFAGQFDDPINNLPQNYINRKIQSYLEKMYLYKLMNARTRQINSKDVDLFLGILAKSEYLLKKRYPNIRFHIIFWDDDSKYSTEIIQKLQQNGYNLHIISNILPGYPNNSSEYLKLGHPNPLSYELLADYVIKHILRRE